MLKAVCQNTLPFHSHRKITTRFDGGSLTSDAGWLLFGSLDRQHRLCEGFSSCIAESRDRRYVRHDLLKLIRLKWSWFFGQSEGSIKVYSDGEIIPSESG